MIRKRSTRPVGIAAIQRKADAEYTLSPAMREIFANYRWHERNPSTPGPTHLLSQAENDFFLRDVRNPAMHNYDR